MLDYIKGELAAADLLHEEIVVENRGIGFKLTVSRTMLDSLPVPGNEVKIFTELIANDRDFRLFGFASAGERSFFRLICTHVKNVGPATAIRILSGGTVAELKRAVQTDQYGFFSAIKGIGKKSSERIVRELKDYVEHLEVPATDEHFEIDGDMRERNDAVKALAALGFGENTAVEKVDAVLRKAEGSLDVEEIVKQALNPE